MKTILVVEDDHAIARGLFENLQKEGYRVLVEKDGLKGYERAKSASPDLVILDVMLPSMDGFQICSQLKKEAFKAPIFILTGLTQEKSRLEGLSHGADDYIGKPFSVKELLLRIRNAVKQREGASSRTQLLEEEIVKARHIQLASLPRRQPRVGGLEVYGKTIPASEVGGDYFDFLRIDRRRFGVIVADVSGKGLPAAMHVQKMQGIVQSSCRDCSGSEEVLRELQEHLHGAMDTSSFITAVVAVFSPGAHVIQLSQAGHLPVVRLRGGRIRLLKPPGVWIGKSSVGLFNKTLCSQSVDLQPGDLFVFFSDGVIEAKNVKGIEFGLPRFKKVLATSRLSVRRLVDRCFAEVRKFSGGQPQLDDITIVSVKVVRERKQKRHVR